MSTLIRYVGAEAQYVQPVIDGLQKLGIPLPGPVADALRAHAALAARAEALHPASNASSVPALREQLVSETLAAATSGKPLPETAERIADAIRADEVAAVERLAVEQAMGIASNAIPRRIAASASAIEGALAKKLTAVLAEVRKVADVVRTLPLTDPAAIASHASDEQIAAFRTVSKAADAVRLIRDLQGRLRIAQNAGNMDRATAEYEDPSEARQAPENPLQRVVWLATEAHPTVRGPEAIREYLEAQQPATRDPRLRGVEVERVGGRAA